MCVNCEQLARRRYAIVSRRGVDPTTYRQLVWRPKHYIATPHVRLKKKKSKLSSRRQKAFNSIKAFAGRIVRITPSRSSCCHWTWYGYVVLYCRPATQLCYKEITQRMLVWSYAAITRLHKWTLPSDVWRPGVHHPTRRRMSAVWCGWKKIKMKHCMRTLHATRHAHNGRQQQQCSSPMCRVENKENNYSKVAQWWLPISLLSVMINDD